MKKSYLLISALSFSVIGAISYSMLSKAYADWESPHSSLIQRLVTKFNLNQSEVEDVFEEFHKEKHDQTRKFYEERLNKFVEDGKVTNDQKNLILAKFDEMHSGNIMFDPSLTPEQKHEKMKEKRAEIEKWASENGIDTQYLWGLGKGHAKGGFGLGM